MMITLLLASFALAASEELSIECQTEGLTGTVYADSLGTLLGENIDLAGLYGKVSVLMNSASYSEHTAEMMPGMNDLLERYESAGVVGLSFPCNQFDLGQPGTSAQIYNTYKYVRPGNGWIPHSNLHMFTVTNVNGDSASDLFTFLKSACPAYTENIGDKDSFYWDDVAARDLRGAYEKFLIDMNGMPRYRFAPEVPMTSIYPYIEELLAESAIQPTNAPVLQQ